MVISGGSRESFRRPYAEVVANPAAVHTMSVYQGTSLDVPQKPNNLPALAAGDGPPECALCRGAKAHIILPPVGTSEDVP